VAKITEELSKDSKQESGLRVYVQGGGCSGFQYGLIVEDSPGVGDQVFESNGIRLYVDPISVRYLKGAEIDWIDGVDEVTGNFRLTPLARAPCGAMLGGLHTMAMPAMPSFAAMSG
jgi:iron-sulfur cluster assembly accessory protein